MAPRPFPFPLNVGTDVVSLKRIRAVIEKQKPKRGGKVQSNLIPFLRHVFTPREQLEFWARFKKEHLALGTNITRVTEYIGGRWAAKEAVIKAIRSRNLTLTQVEVHRYPAIQAGANSVRRGVFALILDKPAEKPVPNRTRRVDVGKPTDEQDVAQDLEKSSHEDLSEHSSMERLFEGFAEDGIENAPATQNRVTEKGESREVPYEELEGQIAKISISHENDIATAVCIAYEEPLEGDVGGEAAARMP